MMRAHGTAGEPVPLDDFEDVYLKPYILSTHQYEKECKLETDHSVPAPGSAVGGGSAVQGL